MFADELQSRIKQAMRDKDTLTRDVLRVALGDIQTAESRGGDAMTDEKAQGFVRKLVKSNQETIDLAKDPAVTDQLTREIEVLESLLPQTMSPDQIEAALAPVHNAIAAADNDGQAMGVAMKSLKSTGAVVEGRDVNAVVHRMRNA
ncbi:MAG: GatB/YqeY domain-containing protein [Phycisphaeraceae bacterium]|jgi:hypothetical protein|nr:GatB/YqeY domain-containing protein [Phycisphaeraceae bacterium]MDP7347704.1 GatB/YqeY domain-containing protein [Phycisphaeraceae bacterium]